MVEMGRSSDLVGDVGDVCGSVSACLGGPKSFSVCLLSNRRCSSIAGDTWFSDRVRWTWFSTSDEVLDRVRANGL